MQIDCKDDATSRWLGSTIYRHADGDGVGAGARVSACVGNTAGNGFAFTGLITVDPALSSVQLVSCTLELR